jgi:hypothetical protein
MKQAKSRALFEMSVDFLRTIRHYISEDRNLQNTAFTSSLPDVRRGVWTVKMREQGEEKKKEELKDIKKKVKISLFQTLEAPKFARSRDSYIT